MISNKLSILRNRDYLILWTGQTVSSLGSNISGIAYPLIFLALTNSPAQAGIGSALTILPTIIFGLPAGVLVDRLDRKKIMIVCDLGRATILASIPIVAFFGHLTTTQLYISAFLEGTLSVFFTLSGVASIPRIVEKEQITEAISKNNIGDSAASIVGPSIGGTIYQVFGKTIPFVFDSISYLVSVISLLFIKTDFQIEKNRTHEKIHIEIAQGLSWLWHHKIVKFLSFLTAGGAIFGTAQTLIIILIARNAGLGGVAIGTIFSIASVGALIGSIFATRVKEKIGIRKSFVYIRWIQFIFWPAYFFSHDLASLSLITFIFYLLSPIYAVVLASYRTSLVPDEYQGRVTSVYRIIMFSGAAIGTFSAGVLAQYVGINWTLIAGLIIIGALALTATLNTDLKKADST